MNVVGAWQHRTPDVGARKGSSCITARAACAPVVLATEEPLGNELRRSRHAMRMHIRRCLFNQASASVAGPPVPARGCRVGSRSRANNLVDESPLQRVRESTNDCHQHPLGSRRTSKHRRQRCSSVSVSTHIEPRKPAGIRRNSDVRGERGLTAPSTCPRRAAMNGSESPAVRRKVCCARRMT